MKGNKMNQSESINELLAALSKAQGELEPAEQNSTNPHFKSKYADLASVWKACRKPLADNGLSVIQLPAEFFDNRMSLITRIGHSSGQWIESTMTSPVDKPTPQGIGSVLSYMRRYSLAAALGIYQEDDDANAANLAPKERPATLTDEEISAIKVLATFTHTDIKAIANHFGMKELHEIERLHYLSIMQNLEKKKSKERDAE